MGLERLKQGLAEKAKAREEEIVSAAHAEAAKIVEEARHERHEMVANAKADAEAVLARERVEKTAAARLDARMRIAEAREAVIKEVMDEVWARMRKVTASRDYEDVLKRLVE